MASRFKVGDRVIVKRTGERVKIVDIFKMTKNVLYDVNEYDEFGDLYLYSEDELEIDNSIPEVKIKYFDLANISRHGDWIDLRSTVDVALEKGDYHLIPLGVAMEIPKGYEAHIVPRSSTFSKYGIIQTNGIGIIDNEYNGDNDQWYMPVYATRTTVIGKGDRVCQFRLVKSMGEVEFIRVDNLGNQDRGGLGSTGRV